MDGWMETDGVKTSPRRRIEARSDTRTPPPLEMTVE